MKYEGLTIYKCMEKVNDSLFLPDIQRPYVWDENDIYLLYDSICRDYPINTVLFWFLKKETLQGSNWIKRLKFLTECVEKKSRTKFNYDNQIDTSAIQKDNYFLAIDGQQRITSFYLTLLGTYRIKIKKEFCNADLFYNFDSGIEEIDDDILYEFKFFPLTNKDVFVETINDTKNNISQTKNWIRVKYLYGLDNLSQVQSNIKNKIKDSIGIDISDSANNNVFKLWSKLRYEELISYYKEETQDYDKVLDIFVRTNSGGQKLKYSDLLFSYIKLNWEEARDKFSELLKSLNEGGRFEFDHDFILKTILFIHAKEQDNLKYSTKNFTPSIIQETKDNWSTKLYPAILLMKDIIVSQFQLTHHKLITSNNALIPIIYFNYKYGKKAIGEENTNVTRNILPQIREWLITSMLTGVFGGQSDTILSKAKKAIDDSAKSDYFPTNELYKKFNESKPSLSMKITEDMLDKVSYNSIDSNLVLSLLYKSNFDLKPNLLQNIPEQDHIFSKSEMKEANIKNEKINSIYNIRWVSLSDNRQKSNESFEVWHKRIGQQVSKMHFIPNGNWTVNEFDNFLEARRKEFVKQIIG